VVPRGRDEPPAGQVSDSGNIPLELALAAEPDLILALAKLSDEACPHRDPPDEQLTDPRLVGCPVLGLQELALATAGRDDRVVEFRRRRAGFFGRPRPILTANSPRCWTEFGAAIG
jgi:hypothetical protein